MLSEYSIFTKKLIILSNYSLHSRNTLQANCYNPIGGLLYALKLDDD